MAALWVLLQLADNKSIEAIEAETHIGFAGSDENARRRAKTKHRAMPARARRSAVLEWPRQNQKILQYAARPPIQPAMGRAALCALRTSRQTRPAPVQLHSAGRLANRCGRKRIAMACTLGI